MAFFLLGKSGNRKHMNEQRIGFECAICSRAGFQKMGFIAMTFMLILPFLRSKEFLGFG